MLEERVTFTLTVSQHHAGDYYVSLSPRTTVKWEKARQVWLSNQHQAGPTLKHLYEHCLSLYFENYRGGVQPLGKT